MLHLGRQGRGYMSDISSSRIGSTDGWLKVISVPGQLAAEGQVR